MITEIEDFFAKGCGRCPRFDTADCSTKPWAAGLADLRRLCRKAGLQEVVKWGHPCYMHAGRNIAIIGAFRGDFRLTFFNASLMQDPEGLSQRQGVNTRAPDMLCFQDNVQVMQHRAVIAAYLDEAMGYAERGVLPAKVVAELELPEELVEAMDCDPDLAEAFHALTPGRQKSWVIHLTGSKVASTRHGRIAKGRDKILAGKGALER